MSTQPCWKDSLMKVVLLREGIHDHSVPFVSWHRYNTDCSSYVFTPYGFVQENFHTKLYYARRKLLRQGMDMVVWLASLTEKQKFCLATEYNDRDPNQQVMSLGNFYTGHFACHAADIHYMKPDNVPRFIQLVRDGKPEQLAQFIELNPDVCPRALPDSLSLPPDIFSQEAQKICDVMTAHGIRMHPNFPWHHDHIGGVDPRSLMIMTSLPTPAQVVEKPSGATYILRSISFPSP
ncbi:MAG: hypothetical protein IPI58_02120 [Alphaproteobacteria bacterium]|nr:MAG: hypothetical protein IPI58_02120 [Alphaproteobacteria bacterium]